MNAKALNSILEEINDLTRQRILEDDDVSLKTRTELIMIFVKTRDLIKKAVRIMNGIEKPDDVEEKQFERFLDTKRITDIPGIDQAPESYVEGEIAFKRWMEKHHEAWKENEDKKLPFIDYSNGIRYTPGIQLEESHPQTRSEKKDRLDKLLGNETISQGEYDLQIAKLYPFW